MCEDKDVGAVVSFTGVVRSENGRLWGLEYESYDQMAVKEISNLKQEAKDKFKTDVAAMITMRAIRKTKPIKKSKPITPFGADGRPLGLQKPHVAGYLPPAKSETTTPTTPSTITTPSTTGQKPPGTL